MLYAIEISERTIREAVENGPWRSRWVYCRTKMGARLRCWWVNTMGPGREYERAKMLGWTL